MIDIASREPLIRSQTRTSTIVRAVSLEFVTFKSITEPNQRPTEDPPIDLYAMIMLGRLDMLYIQYSYSQTTKDRNQKRRLGRRRDGSMAGKPAAK